MERGLRLPSLWSSVLREVAWEVVGQFPTLWATVRHVRTARQDVTRRAALALISRTSLLPRTAAAAAAAAVGNSAFSDLLLFERSMQLGWMMYSQGAPGVDGAMRAGRRVGGQAAE